MISKNKCFSRPIAMILAVFMTFGCFCGVAFADGLSSDFFESSFEGYDDFGVMPLSSSITFSRVSSSLSLSFSGFPYPSWNQTVNSIPTSSTFETNSFPSYPSSFTASVSGPAYSVTLSSSSGIQVNGRSTVRVSGTMRVIADMLATIFLSDYSYSSGSVYYPVPYGVALLFDGQEVAYQNLSLVGTSNESFSYDLLGITENSVSTVSLRLDYPAINISRTYIRKSAGSYSTSYFFYNSSGRIVGRVWQFGIVSQSNSYEVEEISTDYLPILVQIYNAISSIGSSVSNPSPMDQFESDYLQNFQSQIQGTEKYLGNGSSVVPDNFVSGSNGQPSVVDSITENIGLSSGALNLTDFANAASSFSGSDSTGEGGMWQFFTQEVADDMATVSGAMFLSDFYIPSDFESELSKWIEDSERRYEKWCNP